MARDRLPEYRPRRRAVTPEEARIWRAVIRDVAPIKDAVIPEEEDAEPPARQPDPPPPPVAVQPKAPPPPARPLPDLATGHTPGLDRRSSDRMKKGQMEIDARLDLHGLTQDVAHATLSAFITRSYDAGRRCVLVITGKGLREGTGVLRHNVPRWLNQSPFRERIIGFSHARPQHGGEGALYILIKRRRA